MVLAVKIGFTTNMRSYTPPNINGIVQVHWGTFMGAVEKMGTPQPPVKKKGCNICAHLLIINVLPHPYMQAFFGVHENYRKRGRAATNALALLIWSAPHMSLFFFFFFALWGGGALLWWKTTRNHVGTGLAPLRLPSRPTACPCPHSSSRPEDRPISPKHVGVAPN